MIEYTTNTQMRACWVVCADCCKRWSLVTHVRAQATIAAPPSHSAITIARSLTTQLTTLSIIEVSLKRYILCCFSVVWKVFDLSSSEFSIVHDLSGPQPGWYCTRRSVKVGIMITIRWRYSWTEIPMQGVYSYRQGCILCECIANVYILCMHVPYYNTVLCELTQWKIWWKLTGQYSLGVKNS